MLKGSKKQNDEIEIEYHARVRVTETGSRISKLDDSVDTKLKLGLAGELYRFGIERRLLDYWTCMVGVAALRKYLWTGPWINQKEHKDGGPDGRTIRPRTCRLPCYQELSVSLVAW